MNLARGEASAAVGPLVEALVGAPVGPAGVRFPDLSRAYDPVLGARLEALTPRSR